MNRCLHLTIHQNAATLPRRGAAADLSGRASSDPESNPVIAPVDDPESNPVIAPVDDPGSDEVIRRLDDSNSFPSGGSGGCGEVVATACSCCCAPACQDTAAPGKTTPNPFFGSRDYSGFVIVRMAEGIESGAETLWKLAQDHKLAGLQAVLELRFENKANGRTGKAQPAEPPEGILASRPLVELYSQQEEPTPLARDTILDWIHDLEKKTASTAFPPLHSLASYWRLDLRERPDLVEEVVARLHSLAEVGLAYRELAATNDPQGAVNGRIFSEDQGYLDDAPTGISASWVRESLAAHSKTVTVETPSKAPLTLCDLEQGWNLDHQDLEGLALGPLFGVNRAQADNRLGHHGTAVLGLLAAAGKSPFVKGTAAGLCRFVVTSHYDKDGHNGNVAAAIFQALSPAALDPLQPGDILLLEVQRGRLPAELEEEDLCAIRLAVGLGIIVIEAAGNGGFDLDAYSDPSNGRNLRRGDLRFRDSGAILVGAARAGLPHNRAPFSNYGSRLDCFGWGEAVTTCGYGDLAGKGVQDFYTNRFSGTSSASPIIAGAAALLQSLHEAHAGGRLGPQEMREILADSTTGTRQGPKVPGNIGVMPDLKGIVRDRLQLVPDVYLRRSMGDDGSAPAAGDEISSSPDILVWPEGLTKAKARWGERGNIPAPGGAIATGQRNNLYVRLRNRGLGLGEGHVQLFASPAATLITTERWIPAGQLDASKIPQGDTLSVAGPVVWTPPASSSHWSFLAVFTQPGERPVPLGPPYFNWPVGLPPGPPYFDWEEYLAFLRKREVAWRNTHRVSTASPTLQFGIAGTPEQAHVFDFEVIQRLPDNAAVALKVGDALAAKLRQRQPLLKDEGGALALPKRPRMEIRGVELAAGAYADATLTVRGSALTAGHSLAIRQLWRGKEVGRITWFFGPPT